MENTNIEQNIKKFTLYPTLTSNVNIMDFNFHPNLTIGRITNDRQLKDFLNFNMESKNEILFNIDDLLKKELPEVSFEQVSDYFLNNNKNNQDLLSLNKIIERSRNNKMDKLKLKMTGPSPSMSSKNDEEMKKKNLLKMNPFKIPNPNPTL